MKERSLNSGTVEIIQNYINKLCTKMNESPQEVEEFREEMTTNLMSGVQEWMSRGYTESDAVYKALECFGETNQIEAELTELYRIKKVFSGNILKSAIVLFLLGSLTIGWYLIWNNSLHYEVAKNAFNIVEQEMGTAQQPVSDRMKEKLQDNIVESMSNVGVVLRVHDKDKAPQEYPVEYSYPQNLKLDSLNNIPYEKNLLTYVTNSGTVVPIPGTNKSISIDLGVKLLNDVTFMIGITLLFGYWILFVVWASMNVYYRGHGKLLWVILFLLFNVLGYSLYMMLVKLNKKKQQKLISNYV